MIRLPALPEPRTVEFAPAWLGEWIEPKPQLALHTSPEPVESRGGSVCAFFPSEQIKDKPEPSIPTPPPSELIEAALDHPIGALPLARLIKPGTQPGYRAVVIFDDITRATPVGEMLPHVLARLEGGGLAPGQITLVAALGSHRLMTPAEIEAKIGADIPSRYRLVQADCRDDSALVYLGEADEGLAGGIPAWVQRSVVEADLRIGLGMITPHMDAGFSGGAKIILPGVCGRQTLDAFHARAADSRDNPLGGVDAPLRRALETFVMEQVGLDFIVNLVLTPQGGVAGCAAGHPIAAHRQGAALARQIYGAPARQRYPIVIANCAPYQHDLWQSCKGLWCGDLLTAPGGTLIWITQAPEGCRDYPNLPGYIGREPAALKQELDGGRLPDPAAAATGVMIGRMKQRYQILLVSEGLDPAAAAEMGLAHFSSAEAALAFAVNRLPAGERNGCLAVIPQAGTTLPLVTDIRF